MYCLLSGYTYYYGLRETVGCFPDMNFSLMVGKSYSLLHYWKLIDGNLLAWPLRQFYPFFLQSHGPVSNKRDEIFYFHPHLGKIPILTNIFQMGWNHQLGWDPTLLGARPFSVEKNGSDGSPHFPENNVHQRIDVTWGCGAQIMKRESRIGNGPLVSSGL